ncbi:MAG: hypothetical protein ACON5A_00725 [Candidatus Comchoanobacterales bacterium]
MTNKALSAIIKHLLQKTTLDSISHRLGISLQTLQRALNHQPINWQYEKRILMLYIDESATLEINANHS